MEFIKYVCVYNLSHIEAKIRLIFSLVQLKKGYILVFSINCFSNLIPNLKYFSVARNQHRKNESIKKIKFLLFFLTILT